MGCPLFPVSVASTVPSPQGPVLTTLRVANRVACASSGTVTSTSTSVVDPEPACTVVVIVAALSAAACSVPSAALVRCTTTVLPPGVCTTTAGSVSHQKSIAPATGASVPTPMSDTTADRRRRLITLILQVTRQPPDSYSQLACRAYVIRHSS